MSAVYLNELGIVCGLGVGKAAVARALLSGESGVERIQSAVPDGTTLPFVPVTADLPGIPTELARFTSRNLALALGALAEIEAPIRRIIEQFGPDRVAVVMGTSTSGIAEGERTLSGLDDEAALPEGYDFLCQEIGSVAESIAVHYRLLAPAVTVSTACSSGAKALATARRLIRQGLADAVIAGGCDSRCQLTLNGFQALSALTTDRCLPFSANRDGTMIGEGAAVFLLSSEPGGAELIGVGESSDAHNMTAPQPDGRGARDAMLAALQDAGLAADAVSYVNLHGTGTPLNDTMEAKALAGVFPRSVPCSSSKGQLGHTLGAAGAVEAAVCWLTLCGNREGYLPPHVWDGIPDPQAPLAGLVNPGQQLPDRSRQFLMSNSYAFGGSNISVLLGA